MMPKNLRKRRLMRKARKTRKIPRITPATQALILRSCESHWMGLMAMLALCFGLRRDECLALRWGDINMDKMSLCIRDLKNVRSIPLSEIAIEFLSAARKKATSDYVFPDTNGEAMTQISFRAKWKSYLRHLSDQVAADISADEIYNLSLSALRHTHASSCSMFWGDARNSHKLSKLGIIRRLLIALFPKKRR